MEPGVESRACVPRAGCCRGGEVSASSPDYHVWVVCVYSQAKFKQDLLASSRILATCLGWGIRYTGVSILVLSAGFANVVCLKDECVYLQQISSWTSQKVGNPWMR